MASLLLSIGLLSLAHAGYSTYEYNQFVKHTTSSHLPLPNDIIAEVVVALLLLTYYAFSQIKPTEKLSLVDKDRIVKSKFKLKKIQMQDSLTLDETAGGNIYSIVENRGSFMDLDAKRREFKEWEQSIDE
ncbi:hypothetical protein WICPIJ_007661 [Wickerhamomyces pijperi]|uniref:ER membrane protein complex subunit 5 n=1 Tax=Wickerhamomyces pijperi TaxID=599730 RepID=A0A9P8PZD6_WICPI|nr:hypothetical protein WICPIJ_007661 [Wickerhamomyces pijperi]